jgi:hypothetical protein
MQCWLSESGRFGCAPSAFAGRFIVQGYRLKNSSDNLRNRDLSNQMGCCNIHEFPRSDDLRGFPIGGEMLLVSRGQVIRTCSISAFDEHIVVGIACHAELT